MRRLGRLLGASVARNRSSMFGLANPDRFLRFTSPLMPVLWVAAGVLLTVACWQAFAAPEDYQQGDTVRIMFVHVPAASLGLAAYAALGVSSFFALVFRHAVADAAARAAALPGAAFTALALVTGSLWGKPMWGAWWAWGDARLMSVLILFLFYIGYLALRASIDDEQKASRAAAILGLVGLINLPIVKFSVDWWNTLHQPASLLRAGGPSLTSEFLTPLLVMMTAWAVLFLALWLTGIRTEIVRRRVLTLRARRVLEA
jgi:heme exporter protein C